MKKYILLVGCGVYFVGDKNVFDDEGLLDIFKSNFGLDILVMMDDEIEELVWLSIEDGIEKLKESGNNGVGIMVMNDELVGENDSVEMSIVEINI